MGLSGMVMAEKKRTARRAIRLNEGHHCAGASGFCSKQVDYDDVFGCFSATADCGDVGSVGNSALAGGGIVGRSGIVGNDNIHGVESSDYDVVTGGAGHVRPVYTQVGSCMASRSRLRRWKRACLDGDLFDLQVVGLWRFWSQVGPDVEAVRGKRPEDDF